MSKHNGISVRAASDLHGVVPLEVLDGGADIVVLAGDIAPLDGLDGGALWRQRGWVTDVFVPFMEARPGTEFVFVPGNHDFWGEDIGPDSWIWPRNAHCLRNTGCEVLGLSFYGMPNIPEINGRWAFESRRSAMSLACAAIPDGTDVLIAHTPPMADGCDMDSSDGRFDIRSGERLHFGSPDLADAIDRISPRFLFCGHIHTGSHDCTEIGRTKCFNVSLLDESYRQAYSPLDVLVETNY